MLNLIKKEFLVQRKYSLIFFGYSIFMLIVLSLSPGGAVESVYAVAGVTIIYMFVQYSCAIEDKNNSEKILNSLPVSRNKIVFSKFISVILFSVFITVIIGLLGELFTKLSFLYIKKISIEEIISILTTAWILASVYLPIYFKFGDIKAKLFNIIIFFVFFSGSLLFNSIIKIFFQNSFTMPIIDSLSNQGPIIIGGIILLIAIIIVTLSAAISTKVYYNREFN
ncbi:MAG: ABC-2 transporter permease [Alkaliphilus sp.]|nr:ABC-2 transporter permease [Alkaliphilus sp.]